MTAYIWKGPLCSKDGQSLCPGKTVDLDPNEDRVMGYAALGYLEDAPVTTSSTNAKKSK